MKIAYWITTVLFCVMMGMSATMYLTANPQAIEGFQHLGYPDYFRTLLGVAKALGVVALLLPMTPRVLKEWAYAGFVINLVSASVSHAAVGDPISNSLTPVGVLGLLLASRFLWGRTRAA